MQQDASERKYTEELFRRHEKRLWQTQKLEAVGRLAGGVAHEFNNLLTSMIGYSDLLLMRLEPGSPHHRHVEQISEVANRAALLTRHLLTFSREQPSEPQIFTCNALVQDTVQMMHPLIGKEITVVAKYAPDLHAMEMVPSQLQQLLVNLLINARDAMPEGGTLTIETNNVELTVSDGMRYLNAPPGHYVRLMVGDTGTGMSPQVLERVFEPFFTTKELSKGTGLSLAVVYSMVLQNRGDIEIKTHSEQGTTFQVYFPQVPRTEE